MVFSLLTNNIFTYIVDGLTGNYKDLEAYDMSNFLPGQTKMGTVLMPKKSYSLERKRGDLNFSHPTL